MNLINCDVLPMRDIRKVADFESDYGWEIFIGHSRSENQCDPITHYVWREVELLLQSLRYVDVDVSVTEYLNDHIHYNKREHMNSVVTDGSFTNHDDILCISFRLNRGFNESYNVIFNFNK